MCAHAIPRCAPINAEAGGEAGRRGQGWQLFAAGHVAVAERDVAGTSARLAKVARIAARDDESDMMDDADSE